MASNMAEQQRQSGYPGAPAAISKTQRPGGLNGLQMREQRLTAGELVKRQ